MDHGNTGEHGDDVGVELILWLPVDSGTMKLLQKETL